MTDTKHKIIQIIEENRNSLFPSRAPEEIADEIIALFEFSPCTKEQCISYILEKNLMEDKFIAEIGDTAELFVNYYSSVDWVVGKDKKQMKSWKKALNNWCKRDWSKKSTAKSKVEEQIKAYMILQNQKN